jgi:DhnA family fructose-bisphosphate aldolase class Ia
MKEVLDRLFSRDGKTVLLPIDHGTAIPVPGLERPGQVIRDLAPFVDGFVVNLGVARACRAELHAAGSHVCLRADVYKPDTAQGSFRVFDASDAREAGAHSLMHMLYPGHPDEARITRECADAVRLGIREGLPVIVEALPVGLGKPEAYTPDAVAFAARQAAELGAAVVKTAVPTGATPDDMRRVVEGCFVPLIVLGGAPAGEDRALLSMVKLALDAGAAGIAVGRNVWRHPAPPTMARRLHALVHGGADVESALALD